MKGIYKELVHLSFTDCQMKKQSKVGREFHFIEIFP
jgi:hypothetical protein